MRKIILGALWAAFILFGNILLQSGCGTSSSPSNPGPSAPADTATATRTSTPTLIPGTPTGTSTNSPTPTSTHTPTTTPTATAVHPFIAKWGANGGDGTSGSAVGQFNQPGLLAMVGNYPFVADRNNHRIQGYWCVSCPTYQWNLFVGSNGSGNGQFSYPDGVAANAAGTTIYVADSSNNRIQYFDAATGTYQGQWGSAGTGDSQFGGLFGVAVGSAGSVFAVEFSNNRVQKFTATGGFLLKWGKNGGDGTSGGGDGEFAGPMGIMVDSSNRVLVVDRDNHRIQAFQALGGTFVAKWGKNGGDGSSGAGNGEFFLPCGIAEDAVGNYYVTDSGNNRVQKFNSSMGFLAKWGSAGTGDGQFNGPRGIGADASGNVWVVDNGNNRVQEFGP